MARVLQIRRGTTQENRIFIGAAGELTMDTDTKSIKIRDGNTPGGFEIPSIIDYLEPTSSNNYQWYIKYSNGWVEQGGRQEGTGSFGVTTINLPVQMINNKYRVFAEVDFGTYTGDVVTWFTSTSSNASLAAVTNVAGVTCDQTTTSFKIQSYGSHFWEVKGKWRA